MIFEEGQQLWTTSLEDDARYQRARDLINAVIGALTSLHYNETDEQRRDEYGAVIQQEIAAFDRLDFQDHGAIDAVIETYPARLQALRAAIHG